MTGKEIKERIDNLNSEIVNLTNPGIFSLNIEVMKKLQEINHLQEECSHEFENGFCKYCYKREDIVNGSN